MSCAHAMTWEQEVIARCTRDGHVLWPHVAAQLGVSVDVARSRLDPSYPRAHIWAPSREPQPEMLEIDTTPPADITDTSSPHNKGPGLKVAIIARLKLGPASAETIAAFIAHSVDSVRPRLSQMKADGMIEHSARMPYTWSIVRHRKDCVAGAKA